MQGTFSKIRHLLSIPTIFLLSALAMWSLARLVFMALVYGDRVADSGHYLFFVFQGVRFDLMTAGLILALPVSIAPIMATNPASWRYFRLFALSYFSIAFAIATFMEIITPAFIEQFDIRPNILFVEYLIYPKEVFGMLQKGYWRQLTLVAIVVPFLTYLFVARLRKYSEYPGIDVKTALILPLPLVIICLLMVRSTLEHRPVNPSKVAISTDLMVNSLALNSLYSALYAVYYASKESDAVAYGDLPRDQIISAVREGMHLDADSFISPEIPTLHFQRALKTRAKPLNLVIILEESLGAEFVGRLGGLPLTPNLDALADEGLWLENLYATGTRSVRGIEAVITGFTPTPQPSVVKLQKSQKDFFTIADLLRRENYETSFFYGGEAHFDNMRSFFMGNGFEKVVEQKDFENPSFVGTWGVCDEDLFAKADAYFSQRHDSGPFFSLIFSSSNHNPFEYPSGKIQPFDAQPDTVNNAVKYADYALGEFFRKAKKSNYWKDTLFLVVADHNSRVYGADLVPIERFHIPGLMLGADIEPQIYSRIASQIDLIPTALSLMGISSLHPAVGQDLLRPDLVATPGRAMMQYNSVYAYMEGDRVVILQQDKEPMHGQYRMKTFQPVQDLDRELDKRALAYSSFGHIAYEQRLYRLIQNDDKRKEKVSFSAF